MTEASLLAKKEPPIGWVIFDNPDRRNAVTYEMWAAMAGVLADFAADPEVRVVVVRGGGERTFVAGADISQFDAKRGTPEDIKRYNTALAEGNAALIQLPKPTIAMIRGHCIGGGLGIALGCDLRIATDDARFGIPAALLGLGYAYEGVKRLVDLVGPSFAKEIFYTARQFDAAEALTMGLVNRVLPRAELDAYCADYTRRISENAPLTIRAVKTAVSENLKPPGERDTALCEAQVAACFASQDYVEGRTAFTEKRKPQFIGA